jgi:hypothetical protein
MFLPTTNLQANETRVGTSSITVPLNSAPYCSSAPLSSCIVLDSTTATFPDGKFNAYTTGWADPDNDELRFEFGVHSALGPQAFSAGTSSSYTFSGLMPGMNTLYVCAIDSYGAKSCEQDTVRVQPPQQKLDGDSIADQILSIELNLGGFPGGHNGDVSSLADAAMQVGCLSVMPPVSWIKYADTNWAVEMS